MEWNEMIFIILHFAAEYLVLYVNLIKFPMFETGEYANARENRNAKNVVSRFPIFISKAAGV